MKLGYWTTLFWLAQSKARVDLSEEDTATFAGNETGLLAAPLHRLVVNKCCAAQLRPPLLLRSAQRIAQDEKTTGHTLIHKAFTPPWAQRRHFLTNKISMQLFLYRYRISLYQNRATVQEAPKQRNRTKKSQVLTVYNIHVQRQGSTWQLYRNNYIIQNIFTLSEILRISAHTRNLPNNNRGWGQN
jgi:hypothetical protein